MIMKNTLLAAIYICSCSLFSGYDLPEPSVTTISTSVSKNVNTGTEELQQVQTSKNQPLSFIIKEVGALSHGNKNDLLIKVEFKNMTCDTLKLLDQFDPIGIFFSVTIIPENGQMIQVLRGGKADFPYNMLSKRIPIAPKKSYLKILDLNKILTNENITLAPGKYMLSMAYHNQYGDNCIQGWFESNKIGFQY